MGSIHRLVTYSIINCLRPTQFMYVLALGSLKQRFLLKRQFKHRNKNSAIFFIKHSIVIQNEQAHPTIYRISIKTVLGLLQLDKNFQLWMFLNLFWQCIVFTVHTNHTIEKTVQSLIALCQFGKKIWTCKRNADVIEANVLGINYCTVLTIVNKKHFGPKKTI